MQGEKFPLKLHDFLEYATSDEKLSSIVSWLPDGRSFNVHDQVLFTKLVIPKYFGGMCHYRSFRRQLNLYGINKKIVQHSIITTPRLASAENQHHHPGRAGIVPGTILLSQRGGSCRHPPFRGRC
jgi:HSF-type DNA-binding